MVTVLAPPRCDRLERLVQVGDGARLELDRSDSGGGPDDENGRNASAQPGGRDRLCHRERDVVGIILPPGRYLAPVGRHHG